MKVDVVWLVILWSYNFRWQKAQVYVWRLLNNPLGSIWHLNLQHVKNSLWAQLSENCALKSMFKHLDTWHQLNTRNSQNLQFRAFTRCFSLRSICQEMIVKMYSASFQRVYINLESQLIPMCSDPWRNGSASDSRSEGCVFDSRRVQNPDYELSWALFLVSSFVPD